jgi:K+-transporting ATPase KdpF subunit
MSWIVPLAGVVSLALFVYLVVALLKPEWFQ